MKQLMVPDKRDLRGFSIQGVCGGEKLGRDLIVPLRFSFFSSLVVVHVCVSLRL